MLIARFLVFLLAFGAGIAAHSIFEYFGSLPREEGFAHRDSVDHSDHWGMYPKHVPQSTTGSGSGWAACGLKRDPSSETLPGDVVTNKDERPSEEKPRITKPLRITYKEKAQYSPDARANGIEGNVTLRVTFLASGGIGSITTVKGLPFGLTEQAISAAREIKFEPEEVNGVPRTTTRPVTFSFNIY